MFFFIHFVLIIGNWDRSWCWNNRDRRDRSCNQMNSWCWSLEDTTATDHSCVSDSPGTRFLCVFSVETIEEIFPYHHQYLLRILTPDHWMLEPKLIDSFADARVFQLAQWHRLYQSLEAQPGLSLSLFLYLLQQARVWYITSRYSMVPSPCGGGDKSSVHHLNALRQKVPR